jgi:hypothetical protein
MTTAPFKFTVPGFTVDSGYNQNEVWAIQTSTPGILLTSAAEVQGNYRLTHEPSGMAITTGDNGTSPDVFGMLTLASDLGKLGDWTRHGREVVSDPVVKAGLRVTIQSADIEWHGLGMSHAHVEASKAALGTGNN